MMSTRNGLCLMNLSKIQRLIFLFRFCSVFIYLFVCFLNTISCKSMVKMVNISQCFSKFLQGKFKSDENECEYLGINIDSTVNLLNLNSAIGQVAYLSSSVMLDCNTKMLQKLLHPA